MASLPQVATEKPDVGTVVAVGDGVLAVEVGDGVGVGVGVAVGACVGVGFGRGPVDLSGPPLPFGPCDAAELDFGPCPPEPPITLVNGTAINRIAKAAAKRRVRDVRRDLAMAAGVSATLDGRDPLRPETT